MKLLLSSRFWIYEISVSPVIKTAAAFMFSLLKISASIRAADKARTANAVSDGITISLKSYFQSFRL